MEVHAADRAMPVSCGWHPWWNRHAAEPPLELHLHAGASYVKDAEEIPTGELGPLPPPPLGRLLHATGRPAGGAALAGRARPHARDVVSVRRRRTTAPIHAICVEPQTAPPDAFTLAPTVVEPGGFLVATATWSWQLTG